MKKMTKKQWVHGLIFLALMILAVLFLLPFFWMLSNSFKGTKELLMHPKNMLPETVTLAGYRKVLMESPFFTWFRNSLIVSVTNTVVIVFSSALIGYVFSKFRFRGKEALFMLLLATMMIPAQTLMIPNFLLMNTLGLYNTLGAIMIPTFVNAFGIYLCRQFCDEIPSELLESARIDGAGDFRIFSKIVLPQIKPAMGALAIFTFLQHWNEYLNPLIMLNNVEKMTLPLALSYFSTQHASDLSATMAAATLIMAPLTIVFLLFQKQFIKGITMTGMK